MGGTSSPVRRGYGSSELSHLVSYIIPNEFIESSMRRLLPIEYQERKMLQQQEITEFGGGTENANIIPIFVCTVSLPGIPCPLHVFEPRYRLMVRRAMESGTREFGMSCQIDESP